MFAPADSNLQTTPTEASPAAPQVSPADVGWFPGGGHGMGAPGSQPPPPPPFFFIAGDVGRFMHPEHDPSAKPNLDENTLEGTGDTSQTDIMTVAGTTGQSTSVSSQLGESSGQLASYIAISPGRLTALFNPESTFDSTPSSSPRSGDSSVNQPFEKVQVVLPSSVAATLVTPDSVAGVSGDQGDQGAEQSANLADAHLDAIQQSKLLLPQAAGLIASALPFDEAAVEKAVDQFFDQLEELGMGQISEQTPPRVLPLSIALLGTVTAVEVARRRLKARNSASQANERKNPLDSEELLGFPELPGSWSTNLT